MTWSDALGEAFPPRRDDEPSSLRADIADELADHLEAAFARERSRCHDEAEARQTVLRRFGDPQCVTRRLWFDAMKGEIMTQRVLVAAVTLMSLACLSVAGLAWRSVRQSDENNRAVVAQLAEMVASMKKESEPLVDMDVQCVFDKVGGAPAEGCKASLSGPAINAGETLTLNGDSDASGNIRYASIRPGAYFLTIITPSGWSYRGHVSVQRESNPPHQVVCPSAPPATAEVTFDVDWPEEYRNRELTLVANFQPGESATADRRHPEWHWNKLKSEPPISPLSVALNAKNESLSHLAQNYPHSPGQIMELFKDKSEAVGQVRWFAGKYTLRTISVLERSIQTRDDGLFAMKNLGQFYFQPPTQLEFVLKAGQPNHWTIKVPPSSALGWRRPDATVKAANSKPASEG